MSENRAGGGLPLENFFEHTSIEDGNDVASVDPRRSDTQAQLRTSLRALRTPKHNFQYRGVVVNVYPSNTATYVKRGQALSIKAVTSNPMNPQSNFKLPVDTESTINVYKVWMRGDSKPWPCGPSDPALYSFPEIQCHESLRDKEPFSVGTIVDLDDKNQSTIVNYYPGAVPIQWKDKAAKASLWKRPAPAGPPRSLATAVNPENVLKDYFKRPGKDRTAGALQHYPPGSEKAKTLLRQALREANLPTEWADWLELHNILARESNGMVGIPNYTYGWRKGQCADGHKEACKGPGIRKHKNAHHWPSIWALAQQHIWPKKSSTAMKDPGKLGSTATGLGQLLSKNVVKYYPGGLGGIGKPLPEAIGFVKYIFDRYGDPRVAWSVYSRGGKGAAAVEFKIQNPDHPKFGETKKKGFKEGY